MKKTGFILPLLLSSTAVWAVNLNDSQKALIRHVERINPEAMVRMIDDWEVMTQVSDVTKTARRQVAQLKNRKHDAVKALRENGDELPAKQLLWEMRKIVLQLPAMKDLEVLVVRHDFGKNARKQGNPAQPSLACYNIADPSTNKGIASSLAKISNLDAETPTITTLYKPQGNKTIACLDLNFDGSKAIFVSPGPQNKWHLWETKFNESDSSGNAVSKRISPDDIDYDFADCCYLPDGKLIVTSTAPEQGLPCESGRVAMSNSYRFNPDSGAMERLTFDQDSNWYPSVMEDGRVMFVRWEYCDITHFFSRIVMTMHPDGTSQMAYFGSNGFWPNHYGNPLPIPGSNSKFISVVTGHHAQKPGRLCLFDVSKARAEAAGAVQMIPGWQKPIPERVEDYLYSGDWPKFLQPFPLGTSPDIDGAGKYFLVSMRASNQDLWGIYLVDVFDNMTLLYEDENAALNEPIKFSSRRKPAIFPDSVDYTKKTCTVRIADIYKGPGLRGVPRGTVKSVRAFAYHYSYLKTGSHEGLGTESSWDIKYVLGTIPVNEDGSVFFTAPAHTPISLQPLDANGSAVQLMRSWFVGMPGESVTCIGCHESANSIYNIPARLGAPVAITPFEGNGKRSWSFMKEIQPILQRKCVGCHNSSDKNTLVDIRKPNFADISPVTIKYREPENRGIMNSGAGAFTRSYHDLNPFVRRPGPESDNHLFNPYEYNANTSPLIQLLKKGHHGVKLTEKEYQAFYTWIDLNVPFWGTWTDFAKYWANESHRNWIGIRGNDQQLKKFNESRARRIKWAKQYQCYQEELDPELEPYGFEDCKRDMAKIKFEAPNKQNKVARKKPMTLNGWPMSVSMPERREFDLPGGKIAFRKIPAGKFIMGDAKGYRDEQEKVVAITKPFYMAEIELPNKNFTEFSPSHYSGYIDMLSKDHTSPGIDAMKPNMPVIRVSFDEANAYCDWLSEKLGKKVRLPTEEEWEWAARAGTDTPFYWGNVDSDFGQYANLADKALNELPSQRQTFNYYLRDMSVNDSAMVVTNVGKYKPNGFGLKDMIGNVCEWTSSNYGETSDKVTRGGSWDLLPRFSRVSIRTPYHPWQRVANVGIRLVVED